MFYICIYFVIHSKQRVMKYFKFQERFNPEKLLNLCIQISPTALLCESLCKYLSRLGFDTRRTNFNFTDSI